MKIWCLYPLSSEAQRCQQAFKNPNLRPKSRIHIDEIHMLTTTIVRLWTMSNTIVNPKSSIQNQWLSNKIVNPKSMVECQIQHMDFVHTSHWCIPDSRLLTHHQSEVSLGIWRGGFNISLRKLRKCTGLVMQGKIKKTEEKGFPQRLRWVLMAPQTTSLD